METATYKTTGMHCPSCSMNIQLTLEEIDGISAVKADHAAGTTVVEFDTAKTGTDAIAEAITAAGYNAELAE